MKSPIYSRSLVPLVLVVLLGSSLSLALECISKISLTQNANGLTTTSVIGNDTTIQTCTPPKADYCILLSATYTLNEQSGAVEFQGCEGGIQEQLGNSNISFTLPDSFSCAAHEQLNGTIGPLQFSYKCCKTNRCNAKLEGNSGAGSLGSITVAALLFIGFAVTRRTLLQ